VARIFARKRMNEPGGHSFIRFNSTGFRTLRRSAAGRLDASDRIKHKSIKA
jgi:hypothetical protein